MGLTVACRAACDCCGRVGGLGRKDARSGLAARVGRDCAYNDLAGSFYIAGTLVLWASPDVILCCAGIFVLCLAMIDKISAGRSGAVLLRQSVAGDLLHNVPRYLLVAG